MTDRQQLHIGMINSFNVITRRNTVYEIMTSGIGYFAHIPDIDPDKETIDNMVNYFSDIEMYEKCIELTLYMEENFNEDGSEKKGLCQCNWPTIDKYEYMTLCSTCNLRIRK
jgi:hypothetical protein